MDNRKGGARSSSSAKLCFLAFFVFLIAFHLSPAPLFAQNTIRVGVYENSPKVFTSGAGEPSGIFIDIISAVAAAEGWNLEFRHGTWSQGLDRLERGEIDLMPDVAYTSGRSAIFEYHEEPALSDWFQVYARRGSGIRGIPDLDGKKVSILDRSIQQEAFTRLVQDFELTIHFLPFTDYTTVFQAVAEGRTDAAITNRFFGARHMHQYEMEDTAVIFNPTRLFFAAPKSVDPAILQAIDRNLRAMKEDPDSAYFRSLKKWTSEDVPAVIPQWLKSAAILLGALTLLGGITSLALKRQVVWRTKELVQLFENTPMGIFLSDENGTIRKANAEGARLLGFEANSLEGKPVENYIACKDGFDGTIGKPFNGEGKGKNGALPLSCVTFPLRLSGRKHGFYTIFQDISLHVANEKRIGAIIRDLNRTVSTLKKSWEQTIQVLAGVSEVRDPYTTGHQRRVAELARAIAEELGMDRKKTRQIELAALIHDIGKIEIPSEILSKPGRLSEVEYRLIRTHPAAAYKILQSIDVPWSLADIVYQHHERMDGSGYPNGLKGDEILMEARIISVADTVEAMSSHRPYRAAKGLEAALDEVTSRRGILFDPEAVDACLRLFREERFSFSETGNDLFDRSM